MASTGPTATILDVRISSDVVRVQIEFDRLPSAPIAPTALHRIAASKEPCLFELHRLVRECGLICSFETYGENLAPPATGTTYVLRSWWNTEAMDAALDVRATWISRAYPNDGTHAHCIFTWETISTYCGESTGWWSEDHGWITSAAYRDHIEHDIYKLRHKTDA